MVQINLLPRTKSRFAYVACTADLAAHTKYHFGRSTQRIFASLQNFRFGNPLSKPRPYSCIRDCIEFEWLVCDKREKNLPLHLGQNQSQNHNSNSTPLCQVCAIQKYHTLEKTSKAILKEVGAGECCMKWEKETEREWCKTPNQLARTNTLNANTVVDGTEAVCIQFMDWWHVNSIS